MFSNENLDELAKRAKEQLAKQTENAETEENDIYAEFRNECVNSDKKEEEIQEIKLESTPKKIVPNPTLSAYPEDGEYEKNPELTPYDEPIFANGPGLSQVEIWKKQWPGYVIMVADVLDEYFVFRTLNRFEYKQLTALPNLDPLQREEIICETCTLWPQSYDFKAMAVGKAGIPSTYAQIIMENSGFTKNYSIQIL
jgi:hypothetical protein